MKQYTLFKNSSDMAKKVASDNIDKLTINFNTIYTIKILFYNFCKTNNHIYYNRSKDRSVNSKLT